MTCVLGIDAGNTKTLAVLADSSGRVLGSARGVPANIYQDFGAATRAIETVAQAAMVMAGVSWVAHVALSATGADWPEDFGDLRRVLSGLELGRATTVVNDAVGAIWSGSDCGEGVAVVVGTSAGIGARCGARVWHTGYWQEPEGAVQLGKAALRRVYRAALGLEPPTRLTDAVLGHFGLATAEAVLHAMTARTSRVTDERVAALARVLLDEASLGDAAAQAIVQRHAAALGDYALVAIRQVGLGAKSFPLILTGGVLRHPDPLLREGIMRRVLQDEPGARPHTPMFEPVGGAVCIALEAIGCHTPEARAALRATFPPAVFYAT